MQAKLFDTHAHYDDEKFDETRQELLTNLCTYGVDTVVNAGAGLASTKASFELSQRYPFIYFASGVHPENAHIDSTDKEWKNKIEQYALDEKCLAIGEIGLDYYYGKETADIQKEVFCEQLKLAHRLSKPVIIHDREAHADCLDIISSFEIKGVFHSYSGSFEMAKILLKKGWYLSFNGIITFKNARKTVEVLEGIKTLENGKYLDRILVETDAPYLAPVPMRGKLNHSGNMIYTAQKMSEILGISLEDFCKLAYDNSCVFYGLNKKVN